MLTFFSLAIVIHCNHLSYDVVHKVGEFVHLKTKLIFGITRNTLILFRSFKEPFKGILEKISDCQHVRN